LLFAGLLLAAAAHAQDASEPIAVPKLSARVIDQTGTLTPAEKQPIEAKLAAFEQAKGSQVVVLMVPTIGPEPIEDFALRVTDAWKLGRAGVDDGVLFVIAKQQRKIRIHTGRGVQGTLTDAASKRIIAERVSPAFRNGDFAGGISAGVDAILKAIEGEALPAPAATKTGRAIDTVSSGPNFLWLAFFGVPILAMVLRPMLGRGVGAGLTGGITGGAAWLVFGSLIAGGVAAVVAFLVALAMGASALRQGRSSGWSGGWGGGGGGWGGSGGGGFSGGGGGFDGGGASGDW
jgi:uncharacterized protein